MGESTWAEHFAALRRLAADPACSPSWWAPLHHHELAIMAISWDWLERVFQMVADGRLKQGWEDEQAIKDVQRDFCRDAPRPTRSRAVSFGDQYRVSFMPTHATGSSSGCKPHSTHVKIFARTQTARLELGQRLWV